MAINNAIVVSKVQQKGRKLILIESNEISYQHSADLLIELQVENTSSSPFHGLLLEAMAKPAGGVPYHCPIIEDSGKKYIMLSAGALSEQGTLKLSIGGINEEKLVVTSNTIDLCVDESNGIVSKVSPIERYWQIEVYNAIKYWFEIQVKPEYDEMRENLEQAESARVVAESSRVSAENIRKSNENTRVSNENTRRNAETSRISEENSRKSAETSRVNAESARVTSENTRVINENARVSAESTRNSNENTRRNAESNRVSEETRRATAETSRSNAESTRVDNENARVGNESDRQSAESSRVSAETSRRNSETNRINSETSRVNAENARVAAETKRQEDTTAAVNRANAAAERCEDVAEGNYATQADITQLESKKLDKTGGTIDGNLGLTGNLTLKGIGNFGNKLNFGDNDYVHLHEVSDDTLEIKGTRINITNSNGGSTLQVTDNKATYNGNELLTKTGGVLTGDLQFPQGKGLLYTDGNTTRWLLQKISSGNVQLGNSSAGLTLSSNNRPVVPVNGSAKPIAIVEEIDEAIKKVGSSRVPMNSSTYKNDVNIAVNARASDARFYVTPTQLNTILIDTGTYFCNGYIQNLGGTQVFGDNSMVIVHTSRSESNNNEFYSEQIAYDVFGGNSGKHVSRFLKYVWDSTANTYTVSAIKDWSAADAVAYGYELTQIKTLLNSVSTINTNVNSHSSSISTYGTRLNNIESKNTSQDTRLTNIESKNTSQDTRLTNIENKNTTQDTNITSITNKLKNFLSQVFTVTINSSNFNQGSYSGTTFCIAHKGTTYFNGEFIFLSSYSASYSNAITIGTIADARFRPKAGVAFLDVPVMNSLLVNENQFIGHCDIMISTAGVITVRSGSLTCDVVSGRWIRLGGRNFPNIMTIDNF